MGTSIEHTNTSDLTDEMAQVIEQTRERILHALMIFPFISGSMLNQAIGTSTPTKLWQPLLDQLISEGKVSKTNIHAKSPTGRAQTYTVIHLSEREYKLGNGVVNIDMTVETEAN